MRAESVERVNIMSGCEPIIDVRHLCKEYPAIRSLGDLARRRAPAARRVEALEDVSFTVAAGSIAAVVGLNGAGKTTLLKILCNLLTPSSGEVRVAGCLLSCDSPAARMRIGYVPTDERSFFWRISARANLEFFAGLYHIPRRAAARRIDALLEQFGLLGRSGGHFRDYSSGMRKRLAIVRALLHDPQVLIMDEPTNSLDPHWDRHLRRYVRDWVRAGGQRSVVWSTHRMEEVGDVSDDVIQLAGGRLATCAAAGEWKASRDDLVGVGGGVS